MKKKDFNVNFKIEYKGDMDARHKFIDFLVDCLMKNKKEGGNKYDKGNE